MKRSYSTSFKIQAVEKALNRNDNTTLTEIAASLGVGVSTLCTWTTKAKNQEFETALKNEITSMSNDKRPQDWSLEERFNMIVESGSLSEDELNKRCREQGIYPHHVKQWKLYFINGNTTKQRVVSSSEIKNLKYENKSLKKELHRKDKALAETAALLVLKKKVQDILGGRRGLLTSEEDRQVILSLIKEATDSGARKNEACEVIGISAKTVQRWSSSDSNKDRRIKMKNIPPNKLSELERARILKLINEPEFANLPPSQIVPRLADRGEYLACESTIYRILKAEKQLQHRLKSKVTRTVIKPKALIAEAPNQVYTWDITYLPV